MRPFSTNPGHIERVCRLETLERKMYNGTSLPAACLVAVVGREERSISTVVYIEPLDESRQHEEKALIRKS